MLLVGGSGYSARSLGDLKIVPMNRCKSTLKLFIVGMLCAASADAHDWDEPEKAVHQLLGFPVETDERLEVRIWKSISFLPPQYVYRIIQTANKSHGQLYIWDFLTDDEEYNEDLRLLMSDELCEDELKMSGDFVWCTVAVEPTDWSEVLDRLNIELLWELPEQRSLVWPLDRPRCYILDGGAVGIELVYGARRHQVTYSNPNRCCPWPECQLVVRASKAMPRGIGPGATLKGSPNNPLEDDG